MTSIPKVRVLFILGTRPEVIKLAPLIQLIRREKQDIEICVVDTMQHDSLKAPAMVWFGLSADEVITETWQQQNPLFAAEKLCPSLAEIITKRKPHCIIVQGDTTSAYAGAKVASTLNTPVVHIEAGLRSGNLDDPWPEEYFRTQISRIARWHMAPTHNDQDNLLREGVHPDTIHVVGNTVIDALQSTLVRLEATTSNHITIPEKPFILMTVHRWENLAHRQVRLTQLLQDVCALTDMPILFPVHDNPRVKEWAQGLKASVPGLQLLPALTYPAFIQLLAGCRVVLSDSGGIQEEACFLQKPLFLLREHTERHEAIKSGAVMYMSTDPILLISALRQELYGSTVREIDPMIYGDGNTSQRIVDFLGKWLFRVFDKGLPRCDP
ncbi:MAG: UDP-N-acetylglucosamine 2-epimerase (non-hydrolyzing) [Saprospiraceae bacterium]|nr:UDP-N-acetylglucosamine 2-epimerase (non-hydrolyzing) [Saprospiraceae bacterium]